MSFHGERFPAAKDYWFAFYLLLCFTLMALSFHFPSLNRNFQLFVVELTTPVVETLRLPRVWISDLFQNGGMYINVAEENKELKNELIQYRRDQKAFEVLKSENTQLRSLLDMARDVDGKSLGARVKVDTLSPFTRSVLVNVGGQNGVEKGQEVLGEDGIVGRVVHVFPHYSRILLATDYTFRVPVKILETRVRGIARGTNGRYMELMLLEDDVDVGPNMTVVTTGAGDVFSEGVPVGAVRRMNGKLMIEPEVDFSKIDVVSIQRRSVPGILNIAEESE